MLFWDDANILQNVQNTSNIVVTFEVTQHTYTSKIGDVWDDANKRMKSGKAHTISVNKFF